MDQSIFQKKLASHLQKEISAYFLKKEDYAKNGIFITATYVKISADLSIARIHLSILTSIGTPDEILKEVQSKKNECKKLVASKLRNRFRRFPDLYFYLDDSFDQIKLIDEALNNDKKNTFNP